MELKTVCDNLSKILTVMTVKYIHVYAENQEKRYVICVFG